MVRLSGEGTRHAIEEMTGTLPVARKAELRGIRNRDGLLLDRGLVLFFPGPNSFTGEDCAELHLHGGRAVVQAVLEALAGFEGFRLAEAGEFTRRAFLNGKFDLTEAEALSDLIAAETEAQRRFALANAETRHRALYDGWRQTLIQARAMIEAELDFSDEEDVPGSVAAQVWQDITALHQSLQKHAAGYRNAEIIREGYRVVILGAPNAGKSSLLNTLAQRDIAIVTDEPGTTRDALETALDIDGAKVILTDTAGIRDNPGRVEALGIERAISRAKDADLILALEDMSSDETVDAPTDVPFLRVGNKADLPAENQNRREYDFQISVKTGAGIDALLAELRRRVGEATQDAAEILPFRQRHVQLIEEASRHAKTAIVSDDTPLELRAEELRLSANALGRISGTIDVEDLLDTIFSQFCIGK